MRNKFDVTVRDLDSGLVEQFKKLGADSGQGHHIAHKAHFFDMKTNSPKHLKNAGGAYYISGLVELVPTTAHVQRYIKIVLEKSILSRYQLRLQLIVLVNLHY